MPMAVIAVRQTPRGPLANYVQAVRRGMAGRGMGQDDSGYTIDPDTGEYVPTTTFNIGDLGVPTNVASITPVLGSTAPTGSPATASNSTGSGFNLSAILNSLTGAAAGAEKIYLAGQSPSLVPGTNAIYNAATGQFYNPTTGQVVNPSGTSSLFPAGLSTANLGPILLYGGLAVGAFLLISQMGKS